MFHRGFRSCSKNKYISDKEIKRISSFNFLEAFIDQHLAWKEYITVIENNFSKKLFVLYRTKKVLDASPLKNVFFVLA